MKKIFLKSIIFFAIFSFLFQNIWNIFSFKDTYDSYIWGFKHFYETPSNTIDVIFFGNSQCHCNINTSILWEKYGIASYILSGAGRSISTIYYSIEESLKTQTPKLLIVEATPASYQLDYNKESIYRNSITFNYSSTFINNILSFMPIDKQLNTILKFPIFHSRYNNLEPMDFNDKLYFNRGFKGQLTIQKLNGEKITTSTATAIPRESQIYLEKIISLSKEKNIPLLLISSPLKTSSGTLTNLNYINILAQKYNVPFINFNSDNIDINIDYTTDFASTTHLSFSGSRKMTEYLADYIHLNYKIPNRKNFPHYELWELDSKYTQQQEKQFYLSSYSLEESLNFLANYTNDYIFIISLNSIDNLNNTTIDFLTKLNINTSCLSDKTILVTSKKQLIYQGTYLDSHYINLDNYSDLAIHTSSNNSTEIILNNTNYFNDSNNASIIIYDNTLKKVVKTLDVY